MATNFPVENKPSAIDGTGCFSLKIIASRKKIGNLDGDIISLRLARKRAKNVHRVSIVQFGDGRALDATHHSNELKYINHSCCPNTFMRVAYSQVEFYTPRTIKKGEELTCNYGPTHHDGHLPCRCGSKNCKGFL
jgi:SET domain-containing protein